MAKLSERVLNLTKQQIEHMRELPNVLAESPAEDTNEYAPIESFEDMKLDREIVLSIKAHGFDKPDADTGARDTGDIIRERCPGVRGDWERENSRVCDTDDSLLRVDIDAHGATRRGDGPTAIVLAPTRELAQQIEKETKAFSQAIDKRRFKTTIVVGGSSMNEQRGDLRNGVECVVANGRLIDHIHQNNTNFHAAVSSLGRSRSDVRYGF